MSSVSGGNQCVDQFFWYWRCMGSRIPVVPDNKKGILSHGKASAWNLYLTSTKKKSSEEGVLMLDFDEITDTTAALSQLNCMVEQLQGYTPDWCNQDYKKQFFGCNVPLLSFGILFQGDLKPAASPQCHAATLSWSIWPYPDIWYLGTGIQSYWWAISCYCEGLPPL